MAQRKDDIQDDEDENEFHDMLLDSSTTRHQICGPSNIKNGTSKDYETALPQLETDAERKLRKKSHYIVYLTIFIMSIGFSIVLTGVWPYLQQLDPSSSKEFLGWVIAANPLGQMLAAPFLGWCGNKVGSNRVPFIITIAMFIVGNALYALLPLFTDYVKYLMVASRFIVGVSSANIAVCRSYIASSTKVKERTTAISITAAAQSMGFILGPGLQTLMAYAYEESATQFLPQNETVFTESPEITDAAHSGVHLLNMYTLAAWLVAILGIFNLFLFLPCIYKEHNISLKEARSHCKSSTDDTEYLRSIKHDYVAIAVLLFTNFAVLMVYVLIETLIVPMCLDLYAWTPEYTVKIAGLGLTATGIVALFMFLISGKLANKFTDRKVYILIGLIPLTFAMLVFLPFGNNFPKLNNCDSSNFTRIERTTSVLNHFDVEDILLYSNSSESPKTPPNYCDDLGCPPSQKWCFYTPIIEIPQFIVACTLTTFGYPIAVAIAHAIYSKLIKPTSHGIAMGILTMTGSLSRAFGPIFVTYTYTSFGPFWLFASLFIYLLFILVINCSVYKRLVPLSFHVEEEEEEDDDDEGDEEEEEEYDPKNVRKNNQLDTNL